MKNDYREGPSAAVLLTYWYAVSSLERLLGFFWWQEKRLKKILPFPVFMISFVSVPDLTIRTICIPLPVPSYKIFVPPLWMLYLEFPVAYSTIRLG